MKHRKTFLSFSFIFISILLVSFSADAAVGVVRAKVANVREKPSTRSEVLLKLNRGDRVTIVRQRGKWLQVKVALDKSFTFDGYIFGSLVKWNKPRTRRKAVRRAPRRKPTPKPQQRNLDQFFSESQKKKSARTTTRRPAPPPKRTSSRSLAPRPMDQEKMKFGVGVGYLLYNYKLSTGGGTPGEVFAYNLSGIAAELDFSYWFFQKRGSKFRSGAFMSYQHGFFSTTTNLQDSSGTQFGSLSSKSQSNDLKATVVADYVLGSPVFKWIGLGAGMEWYRFAADDISDDNGPLNLYTGHTTLSVLAGLRSRFGIPKFRKMYIDLNVDVMVLSFLSESPSDATGTSPSAGLGFAPELGFGWNFSDQHELGLGYRLRYQGQDFTGAGTRANNGVTDASATNTIHQLFLNYDYKF